MGSKHHFCWDFINPKITMTRRGLRVFHAFKFYGNILFFLNGEKYPGAYQSWQVLTLTMPDLVLKN